MQVIGSRWARIAARRSCCRTPSCALTCRTPHDLEAPAATAARAPVVSCAACAPPNWPSASPCSPPRASAPPPAVPLEIGPGLPIVEKLAQGDRAYAAGDVRGALFAYQDAAYSAPGSCAARVKLGRAYLALGYAEPGPGAGGAGADARRRERRRAAAARRRARGARSRSGWRRGRMPDPARRRRHGEPWRGLSPVRSRTSTGSPPSRGARRLPRRRSARASRPGRSGRRGVPGAYHPGRPGGRGAPGAPGPGRPRRPRRRKPRRPRTATAPASSNREPGVHPRHRGARRRPRAGPAPRRRVRSPRERPLRPRAVTARRPRTTRRRSSSSPG